MEAGSTLTSTERLLLTQLLIALGGEGATGLETIRTLEVLFRPSGAGLATPDWSFDGVSTEGIERNICDNLM